MSDIHRARAVHSVWCLAIAAVLAVTATSPDGQAGVAGISVAVVQGSDTLLLRGYGYADLTEYLDYNTRGHSVPVRRLLDHTSGIKS